MRSTFAILQEATPVKTLGFSERPSDALQTIMFPMVFRRPGNHASFHVLGFCGCTKWQRANWFLLRCINLARWGQLCNPSGVGFVGRPFSTGSLASPGNPRLVCATPPGLDNVPRDTLHAYAVRWRARTFSTGSLAEPGNPRLCMYNPSGVGQRAARHFACPRGSMGCADFFHG